MTPSNRLQSWINIAVKLARQSQCKWPHGCLVVKGGSVLGTGFNRMIADPLSSNPVVTIHSEHMALRGIKISGATLIVIRLRSNGTLAPSMPCAMCTDRIRAAKISRVIFSGEDEILSLHANDLCPAPKFTSTGWHVAQTVTI